MFGGDWRAGILHDSTLQAGGNFGLEALRVNGAPLVYDLASLTKVVCTATLVADLYLQSTLDWQKFCGQALLAQIPELKNTEFETLTLGECWNHQAGLPPILNFTNPARKSLTDAKTTTSAGASAATVESLVTAAPGEKSKINFTQLRSERWQMFLHHLSSQKIAARGATVYSDVGCLLVGLFLERRHQINLDELFEQWKRAHGLAGSKLSFGLVGRDLSTLAPTETRYALGEVNDDRAFSLGGIAPHSGLFGTLGEVWAWLEALDNWQKQESKIRQWLTPQGESRFFGGWDRPSDPATSLAGSGWPPGVIGHVGYTGTALWWHPSSARAGVLLTNRVFPDDSIESKTLVKRLRREFFSGLWQDKLKDIWGVFQTI